MRCRRGLTTLEAQANGFVPAVLSNVVVGGTDLGNPSTGGEDFPTVNLGGTISGTLTINGNTSAMASPITLYLNAYSPQLGYSVFSQIQLSTSATQASISYQIGGVADGTYQMYAPYLQGFDPVDVWSDERGGQRRRRQRQLYANAGNGTDSRHD